MIYPNMEEIQKLADSECAKYGRIAEQQGGRSSSGRTNNYLASALGDPTANGIATASPYATYVPVIGFRCVNPPATNSPLPPDWPQLK